jgi:hypothetical protein
MVTIPGTITRGLGKAAQTVQKQMPYFLKVCPELKSCRCATINVILECQLEVISPDLLVGPIVWSPGFSELFGLLKIRFEVDEPRSEAEAWIYIPYGSPHRLNPYHVEILAPPLSLEGSPTCKIKLAAGKVSAISGAVKMG